MPIHATRILFTYPISLTCIVCHKGYRTVDDFEEHLYVDHKYHDERKVMFSRYNQIGLPPDEREDEEDEAPQTVAQAISMSQLIDFLLALFTNIVLIEGIKAAIRYLY